MSYININLADAEREGLDDLNQPLEPMPAEEAETGSTGPSAHGHEEEKGDDDEEGDEGGLEEIDMYAGAGPQDPPPPPPPHIEGDPVHAGSRGTIAVRSKRSMMARTRLEQVSVHPLPPGPPSPQRTATVNTRAHRHHYVPAS